MKKKKPAARAAAAATARATAPERARSRPAPRKAPRTSPASRPKPLKAVRSRTKAATPVRRRRIESDLSQHGISRALLSVYDKDGVVDLARTLAEMGVEILSTGGTARYLMDGGVRVTRIARYTGFPEMLDGRVKTLHPKIHAGILAMRDNPQHMADILRAGIRPIDLVVVNLYPFEKTAAIPGMGFNEIVEMIDVGGPSMVRAAAKNFRSVAVIVEPADYRRALAEIKETGTLTEEFRFDLAKKAFQHVAAYDTAVYAYLSRLRPDGTLSSEAQASPYPSRLHLDFVKIQDLRYGENPHQSAGFYREAASRGPSIASALKRQGKELSFNNIVDLDAALALVAEFDEPTCAIIKHNNPCGVGRGEGPKAAYAKAFETDPVSAYGGVIGFNVTVDRETAEAISAQFVEAIVAPSYDPAALELFAAKKSIRVLETGSLEGSQPAGFDLKRVRGGLLAQDWDTADAATADLRVVSRRRPTPEESQALAFSWKIAKHVRSNAIVYALKDRTVGIGAGQMSRLDSAKIGADKALRPLAGCVVASDAFFPFRDGVDEAARHGITAVIQPGGSIRDDEVIAAADDHNMAMVMTGYRHFRH